MCIHHSFFLQPCTMTTAVHPQTPYVATPAVEATAYSAGAAIPQPGLLLTNLTALFESNRAVVALLPQLLYAPRLLAGGSCDPPDLPRLVSMNSTISYT